MIAPFPAETPRTHRLRSLSTLILPWMLLSQCLVCAHAREAAPQIPGTQTTSTSVEVTGHVLNARTNQPVSRALVQFDGRAALTDRDGLFSFPLVTASGPLTVRKPGFFTAGETNGEAAFTYTFGNADPINLILYPESILSGTVTNAAGEGVPHLTAVARRSTFDDSGHHWQPVPQSQTDEDGAFRLALRPGDYALEIVSSARGRTRDEITLPLSVPDDTSSLAELIHLAPGEELPLRLRVETRKAYKVEFSSASSPRGGLPHLIARGSNGLSFPLVPAPSRGDPGAFTVTLPSGTFSLEGQFQTPEGGEEASGTVTVPEHDLTGVALHFAKTPLLPVEVSIDSTSSSTTLAAPTAHSLGISMTATEASPTGQDRTYSVMTTQNQPPAFSLPAGTYRLRARSGSGWVITEATCAGSNLLAQNLTVAAGMGGTPIRISVSDATASISGTVQLNGRPASAWIFLVATTPSATPVVSFQAGSTGSFSRKSILPGSYRIIALAHKIAADMENPATLNNFLDRVQSLTLTSGGQQTLNLDVVPAADLP